MEYQKMKLGRKKKQINQLILEQRNWVEINDEQKTGLKYIMTHVKHTRLIVKSNLKRQC